MSKKFDMEVVIKGLGDLISIDETKPVFDNFKGKHAFPSDDRLIGPSIILQQDNAPCRKSKNIMKLK